MTEKYDDQYGLTETEPRFEIDNDQKAEWAMKKIQEARKDAEEWVSYYKAQIQKVQEACQQTEQNMTAMLEEYFRTVPHRETKTQQVYDMRCGKLYMKHQAPAITRDDDQIIKWAKVSNPGVIKTKETLDWAAMKTGLELLSDGSVGDKGTGEIVPGMTWEPQPDVFQISLKGE